jgi:hypothetical protein
MTAGPTPTDRFLQNTVPAYCLPFDRIGVRHPGIGASADLPIGLKKVWSSLFSFDFRSAGSSATRDACRGCLVDFCGWSGN